jgi:hypothetical protein
LSAGVTGKARSGASSAAILSAAPPTKRAAVFRSRIAAKLGGVVPANIGGSLSKRPGKACITIPFAAGLSRMSIKGDDVENGASRNGQSVTGFAATGAVATHAASAAVRASPRIRAFLP